MSFFGGAGGSPSVAEVSLSRSLSSSIGRSRDTSDGSDAYHNLPGMTNFSMSIPANLVVGPVFGYFVTSSGRSNFELHSTKHSDLCSSSSSIYVVTSLILEAAMAIVAAPFAS